MNEWKRRMPSALLALAMVLFSVSCVPAPQAHEAREIPTAQSTALAVTENEPTSAAMLRVPSIEVPDSVRHLVQRMDPSAVRAALARFRPASTLPAPESLRPQSLVGDILSDLASSVRGERLFNRTVFGSIMNRQCATCHREAENWQITPAFIQAEYARDPNGPLFAQGHDADVQGGSTFTRLLTTATFLVPFRLPPNVTLTGCGSLALPNTRIGPDGACTVLIPRSAGSIRNMALHDNLLWDARLRGDQLGEQAVGAVEAHNNPLNPAQLPTLAQQNDLRSFQQIVPFSSLELRAWAYSLRYGGSVPAPGLPPGSTAAAERGRRFFDPGCAPGTPGCPSTGRPSGFCAQCHSGPMRNEASWDNVLPSFRPDGTPEPQIGNNFVTEFNASGFQVYQFLIQEPVDPPGSPPRVVNSSDPGLVLTTGSLCSRSFLNCVLNPGSGISITRSSSLRGMRQKIDLGIPFFHNNSAPNVAALMDGHYVPFGQLTAFLLQQAGFPPEVYTRFLLTPQDSADIQAYLHDL